MSGYPGATSDARRSWRLGLAVTLLAAIVYANSIGNGFAFDDEPIIERNERVHSLDRLGELVTGPYWPHANPMRSPYRPVTLATYALNWQIAAGAPWAFHAVNVALHAAVTGLLFVLLTGLSATPPVAALAAAVFAVHPVHTEAVANVVGRAELLVALFTLLAAVAWVRAPTGRAVAWVRAPTGRGGTSQSADDAATTPAVRLRPTRGATRSGIIVLCFALALGAKENAIVLPGLLLLLEAFRPRLVGPGPAAAAAPGFTARVWAERWLYGALALVAGGYLLLRKAVLGTYATFDISPFLAQLTGAQRVATSIALWPEYIRLLLFPQDLVAEYGPAVLVAPTGWLDTRVILGLGLGAGIILLALAGRRRWPWLALAVAWVGLAVLPVSNLLFPVGIWLAERTLYLPSVAVSFIVAGAATRLALAPARTRRIALASLGLVLLLGGARTWTRNPTWASTETVLVTLATEHPESFRAQWYLGRRLFAGGNHERGIELLASAHRLVPADAFLAVDYARHLLDAGHDRLAGEVMLALPGPILPDRNILLSESLLRQRRFDEALEAVEQALRWFPNHEFLRTHAARVRAEAR